MTSRDLLACLWVGSDKIEKYNYHITEKDKCGETDTLSDIFKCFLFEYTQ